MKIHNSISTAVILSLALTSSVNWLPAAASKLTITNYEQSSLKLHVVTSPHEEPYCKVCLGSPLRGGATRTIAIPSNAFKGKEFYSVVDVTNGFMGESKCTNLSVFKDYELSFYETTFGTRCVLKAFEIIKKKKS